MGRALPAHASVAIHLEPDRRRILIYSPAIRDGFDEAETPPTLILVIRGRTRRQFERWSTLRDGYAHMPVELLHRELQTAFVIDVAVSHGVRDELADREAGIIHPSGGQIVRKQMFDGFPSS